MSHLGALPPVVPVEQERAALAALGIISASLYATGLALGAESLARTSFWLLYAEEDRYRLLARNMTDVITRHAKNGTVQFVSPAAEPLFGAKVKDLLGFDLFSACRSRIVRPISTRSPIGFAGRKPIGRIPRAPGNIGCSIRAIRLGSVCAAALVHQAVVDRAGEREVVAVMRDITKRKEQEAALEEARAEAERANAAKSRFRDHEPRAAHATQRNHRLLRDADQGRRDVCSTPSGVTTTRI